MSGASRAPALQPASQPFTKHSVAIVIPARNEQHRIIPTLASATSAQVEEVVVVDDHSTDHTAQIARDHGARVVPAPELKDGLIGKPAALQHGLQEVQAQWVLFLDADTRIDEGFVQAAVERAITNQCDFLSFAPRFATTSGLQQLLEASMLAGLVYRFGPPGVAAKRPQGVIGNGQCFLAKRETLIACGGFAPSIGHMTDDIALFQSLAAGGECYQFIEASDFVEVQMYESPIETFTEWGRSLPMRDVLARRDIARQLGELFFTQVLPMSRLLLLSPTRLDLMLIGMRFAMNVALRRSFSKPTIGLHLSAIADPITWLRLLYGSIKPSRRWRGRYYPPSQNASQ